MLSILSPISTTGGVADVQPPAGVGAQPVAGQRSVDGRWSPTSSTWISVNFLTAATPPATISAGPRSAPSHRQLCACARRSRLQLRGLDCSICWPCSSRSCRRSRGGACWRCTAGRSKWLRVSGVCGPGASPFGNGSIASSDWASSTSWKGRSTASVRSIRAGTESRTRGYYRWPGAVSRKSALQPSPARITALAPAWRARIPGRRG